MITIEKSERLTICRECLNTLHFDESDIRTGSMGAAILICPVCQSQVDLQRDYAIRDVNLQNVTYPMDFQHCKDACPIGDDEINKWVQECVLLLQDKDYLYSHAMTGCGDTDVVVLKYKEGYRVIVSKNPSSVDIYNEKNKYMKK